MEMRTFMLGQWISMFSNSVAKFTEICTHKHNRQFLAPSEHCEEDNAGEKGPRKDAGCEETEWKLIIMIFFNVSVCPTFTSLCVYQFNEIAVC